MTATETGITANLARFVTKTTFEDLPPEVLLAAKRAFIDTLGVMVIGAEEPGSKIALEYARQSGGNGEATVVGSGHRTSATLAALVNGAYGHALDYDDMNMALNGHPSIAVLPAVLSLVERQGKRGRDAIVAFAIGYEVTVKLGRALGPSSYARGWHATSVGGTMGAAAAAARLLDLDEEATRNALGIATSMASGSRQNFGTMTKPLHAGLAARNGVEAALLASLGFTADQDIVESRMGFGLLYSPAADWRPELATGFGEPWEIAAGMAIKQYPCCYNTHLALDSAFNASSGRPISEDDIESIRVQVVEGTTPALIHSRPQLGLEGKFSMEYCVSAAVMDGAVKLASFEDGAVARPEAQRLLRRVEVVHVPENPASPVGAEVSVLLKSGERLIGRALEEHGGDSDPLTWDELVAKYRDCLNSVLPPEQVAQSLKLLTNLEQQESMRPLIESLQLP